MSTQADTLLGLLQQLEREHQSKAELLAACNKAAAKLDTRVCNASNGKSVGEAEQILTSAIARASEGR